MIKAGLIVCSLLTAVDGDTVRCDGTLMRILGPGSPFVSGVDTPELRRYHCDAERRLARLAHRRLAELIQQPVKILYSGKRDTTRYRRPLIWIKLPNGRTAGEVLLTEGYARVWKKNARASWCAK